MTDWRSCGRNEELVVKLVKWILVLTLFLLVGGVPSIEAATDTSVLDAIKNGTESEEQPLSEPVTEDRSLFSVIGSLILYTLLIVGLIYGLIKFLASRQRSLSNTGVVRVLGASSMGAQKSVQVIQVGDQVLVVGVGEDISLLAEITDEQQKQRLLTTEVPEKQLAPFQEMLQKSMKEQTEKLQQAKERWSQR
ncbi:hypothetical protein CF394_06415 [Tetzosporium hominis]|uniref:Flagellar protein n=1 Tax=Tetzosporium hominis TaxID=2020506 RepID=A0A264W5S0_9BACL|nr:hypothetical protein CF394_06415 [Tetzosporium hominis]